jgi:prefoldin subunit 2
MDAPTQEQMDAVSRWQQLRSDCLTLQSKLTELEMERAEHELVLSTLTPCARDRTCYRMVGGVLLQRTVGEVQPAVQKNRDNLAELCAQVAESLKRKDTELSEIQRKYNIRIK